jgi:hypothetical protein
MQLVRGHRVHASLRRRRTRPSATDLLRAPTGSVKVVVASRSTGDDGTS